MEEFKQRWREETPLKRLAKPEEIAGAAVYLASDAASYISGHDLVMDGAYVCA